MRMAGSGGGDILLISHKLAAYGDNTTCAAHKICSMLLQNGGRVYYTTVTPESSLASSGEKNEHQSLLGCSDLHLICPREPKGRDKPSVPWISKLHNSYYDSFSHDDERLDNVSYIIGFVPTTADTAIDLADRIKFKAMANRKKDISEPKVVLINCSKVGEDQEIVIEDIEEWVQKPVVDVIFSVGNRLFEHYQGLYTGFNNASSIRKKHREFVFRPNTVFLDEEWGAPSFVKLASFWNSGTFYSDVEGTILEESSIQDYESACKMIGYMSANSKLRGSKAPEWSVHGLKNSPNERENRDSMKKILEGNETFNILPKQEICDEKSLLRVFRSFSAVIAPEHDSDGFNFHAWEAMGFGIPTFVADQSGIATTVKKLNSTVNFSALVKLVGSYEQDVENWKGQVVRELTGDNSHPELWASRLRHQIMDSPYLIESEEQFVKYFGLCRQVEYKRVHSYSSLSASVKPPKGCQETTPDPRMTGGGDARVAQKETGAAAGAAGGSEQTKQFPKSQSGDITRICVYLKKTDAFQQGGGVTCSAELKQEIIDQQSGENPAQTANEHLVNCMNAHSQHGFQGVPNMVKQQWYAFLNELGEEDFEFFSADYDGSAVLSLFNSCDGGYRKLGQQTKDALIKYATLIGINTNTVEVFPYDPATSPARSADSPDPPSGAGDGEDEDGDSTEEPSSPDDTSGSYSLPGKSGNGLNSADSPVSLSDAGDSAEELFCPDDTSGSYSLPGAEGGDSTGQPSNLKSGANHDYTAQPSSSSDISCSSPDGTGAGIGAGTGAGTGAGGDNSATGNIQDPASDITAHMQGLGILDPPGTDLTSLDAHSMPRQKTMQHDDVIGDGDHGDVLFTLGDPGGSGMRMQASLDDGTDGTLPPKNELRQRGANAQSGANTNLQTDSGQRPATPQGQQVEDELETSVKHTANTSFPAGKQLSKYPERDDKTLKAYTWFDWQRFKMLISKTKLWIESPSLKDKIKPVVVAVVDTGVYEAHPDLCSRVLTDKSACFVSDALSQGDLRIDHLNHGTMVAGVIVLNGPVNVKIVNLKVQPAGGKFGDMRDLVKALEHIEKELDEEVHIVNMSMGQHDNPHGLSKAINRLADSKILIASAGNDAAKSANTVTYPALHPNVISVGACDHLGHMAPISAHGKDVDFLCPGKDIVSTMNNDKYMRTHGTSFAAPHAAAVAAHALVALQALAAEDPQFAGHISSAPISIYSTNFMRNFLAQMCTRSQQPDSQGQGHGLLKPWENGFREDYLLKDRCKIALTGRSQYMAP